MWICAQHPKMLDQILCCTAMARNCNFEIFQIHSPDKESSKWREIININIDSSRGVHIRSRKI